MPFDGSGNYSPSPAPNFPAVGGAVISSTYYNAVINDIATAMSNVLCQDGQAKPTASFDWNGKNLTNVGTLGITTGYTSGNFGVGTASPTERLEVVGGNVKVDASSRQIGYWSATGFNDGYIVPYNAFGQTEIVNSFTTGGIVFKLANAKTEYARFTPAGFFGINTTSPQRPAHFMYDSGVVGQYSMILQGRSGGYGTGISFQSVLTAGALAEMARITADGEGAWDTTPANQDAGLRFYTSLDGTVAEKARLTSGGAFGIGTTNPATFATRFTVVGADATALFYAGTTTQGLYAQVDNATQMVYLSSNGSLAGGFIFRAGNTERFRFGAAGQLGLNGANYGTAGQVLVSNGSGSAVSWGNAVTSVNVSGGATGLTFSGGPITSSGTITMAGTLAIANGGTGATTASAALTALGAYPATNPSGYTSNSGTVTSVGGTGSVNGLTLSGTVTSSGNITLGGSVTSVAAGATIGGVTIGWRNIPVSGTTSGTLPASDAAKCVPMTSGVTVPASIFAAGDTVMIYNNSAGALVITQGAGLTLRWSGTASTGNRNILQRGMATVWFLSATEAIIFGDLT